MIGPQTTAVECHQTSIQTQPSMNQNHGNTAYCGSGALALCFSAQESIEADVNTGVFRNRGP